MNDAAVVRALVWPNFLLLLQHRNRQLRVALQNLARSRQTDNATSDNYHVKISLKRQRA